jgi:hypothetical protein
MAPTGRKSAARRRRGSGTTAHAAQLGATDPGTSGVFGALLVTSEAVNFFESASRRALDRTPFPPVRSIPIARCATGAGFEWF